ncbi:MAG: succinylglutamate desuccinylase [Candidatus Nitronauta litoralis]|uniref:Succinylglutamate desuccinylase n=1 Tax=Candidatus Nitronauta litoralis TaxID=2705533 RepID=A0A7T0G0U6_9BACT|nr:MAG: succinylglutamate desuccinylase [Candidatus Nitronauta litoralis]
MKTEVIASFETPFLTRVELLRQSFLPEKKQVNTPRLAFITGLHGDELEGLYVGHRLLNFLEQIETNNPSSLLGEVHVYPAVNPPALNHASRLWPGHGTDMNRTMGLPKPKELTAQFSSKLIEDIKTHADIAVDFHASNLHLQELPQVRMIDEWSSSLLPLAMLTNTDLVWSHPMADLFAATLGYNLNKSKVRTLVIEAGICHRITPEYGDQVFAGIVHLMKETGILDQSVSVAGRMKNPLPIRANQVISVSAEKPGLFVSDCHLGEFVGEGQHIGNILDPVRGKVLEEIKAPASGLLFTLREHPITYAGSLLARVALEKEPPP